MMKTNLHSKIGHCITHSQHIPIYLTLFGIMKQEQCAFLSHMTARNMTPWPWWGREVVAPNSVTMGLWQCVWLFYSHTITVPENVHVCLAIQNGRQTVGSYFMVLNLSWLSFFISSSPSPFCFTLALSLYLLHVLTHPTSWSPSSLSPSPYFHPHLPYLSCTHSFFCSSFSLHLPFSVALACATLPLLSSLYMFLGEYPSPFLPQNFSF